MTEAALNTAGLTFSSWLKELVPPDFRFLLQFPDPLTGYIIISSGIVLIATLAITIITTMSQTIGALLNPTLPAVGASNSFTATLLPTDALGIATTSVLTIPITNPLDAILNALPMPFVPVPGPAGFQQALNLATPEIMGKSVFVLYSAILRNRFSFYCR